MTPERKNTAISNSESLNDTFAFVPPLSQGGKTGLRSTPIRPEIGNKREILAVI